MWRGREPRRPRQTPRRPALRRPPRRTHRHGPTTPQTAQTAQTARTRPGQEQLKVYGGDGCPAIAEFAPADFAAVLGLTSRTGAALIGEALALRHRFPRLWASTLAEHTPVWRARAVARGCLKLSLEAAGWVDQRITGKIAGLSTTKFYDLLDALIKQADPAAARRAAEDHAKERGVFVNPSDGDGTKTIYVKAATGDVIRFDATISDLAWALAMMGDTDTPDQRRAKAIGWIADPAAAYELLHAARYLATHQPTTHPRRRHRPTADADTTADTTADAGAGDAATDSEAADAGTGDTNAEAGDAATGTDTEAADTNAEAGDAATDSQAGDAATDAGPPTPGRRHRHRPRRRCRRRDTDADPGADAGARRHRHRPQRRCRGRRHRRPTRGGRRRDRR